jgi:hypothetical protein
MAYKFNPLTGKLDYYEKAVGACGVSGVSGVNGACGVSGVSGVAGACGVSGVSGVAGGGINPLGAYNAVTNYAVGDSVDYQGSSYIMYVDGPAGTLPTDTDYWQVLANKGACGISGVSGVSGISGANGSNGACGISGVSGVSGISGADSTVAGPAGACGVSGVCGVAGTNGSNGACGVSGVKGDTGACGVSGTASTVAGPAGACGVSGVSGVSGTIGAGGACGISGVSGVAGSNGACGVSGVSGVSGTAGSNGACGISGVSGTTGACGISGVSGIEGAIAADVYSTFSTTTTSPPADQTMRYNNSTPANVTQIYIDETDSHGIDASTILGYFGAGDLIRVTQKSNHSLYHVFSIVSNTDIGDSRTLVVTFVGGNASLFSNSTPVALFFTEKGDTGACGVSGVSGVSGVAGACGVSGTAGTNGACGVSGISGVTGTNGACGISGTAGTNGACGVSGVSGVTGVPGSAGACGVSGVAGACGVSGTAGTAGACGVSGVSGVSGVTGVAGACGVSGRTGACGVSGTAGTAGACGVSGVSGVPGPGTSITPADDTADTSCFPLFANAGTGAGQAKTNANLTWDASGNILGATNIHATKVSTGSHNIVFDNAVALGTPASGTLTNCTFPSGMVVQVVNYQRQDETNVTTPYIPIDNTIPQITEGAEWLTLDITPKSSTNKLVVNVVVPLASGATPAYTAVALFKVGTSDALAVEALLPTANGFMTVPLNYWMTAGTTSTITFKVRIGVNNGITYIGMGTASYYGARLCSSITITEVIA